MSKAAVGRRLAELVPDLEIKRPAGKGPRPRSYYLPPLDVCRADFLKAMNIEDWQWPPSERSK